jgi:hypothetical protein
MHLNHIFILLNATDLIFIDMPEKSSKLTFNTFS